MEEKIMEISKKLQQVKNEGRQKRAAFRMNKKYDDCRLASHVQSCIESEIDYQSGSTWEKWIDIHDISKSIAKHAADASSLFGDYFENGRITRGAAEIRQLHDLARQLRPEGFVFQYGLLPMKDGKKHLAILIRKNAIRVPWGGAPRITRAYYGKNA